MRTRIARSAGGATEVLLGWTVKLNVFIKDHKAIPLVSLRESIAISYKEIVNYSYIVQRDCDRGYSGEDWRLNSQQYNSLWAGLKMRWCVPIVPQCTSFMKDKYVFLKFVLTKVKENLYLWGDIDWFSTQRKSALLIVWWKWMKFLFIEKQGKNYL